MQLAGVVGRAGRALAWLGADRTGHAQRLDDALRRFYRREWRWFLASARERSGRSAAPPARGSRSPSSVAPVRPSGSE